MQEIDYLAQNNMKFVFFILSFILSFILTPVSKAIANRTGVIDVPKDERRVHSKPIPLLGGLAIFISVMVFTPFIVNDYKEMAGIMLGGIIIFITGVVDDAKDLNPKLKFLLQIVAASVACYFGVRIDFLTNPTNTSDMINLSSYIAVPISIFWIVGITNTINLIDGLDGLSSGLTAISAISFSIIASRNGNYEMTLLSLVLAGTCLGFLPYNFNPASIFVGDSGAMFMGFMLACISIQAVIKSTAALSMIIPILGIAIPILDTSFAIIRRFINGKKIFIADKGHVHHRLLAKGYSQRQTVLILYLISIVYSALGILISRESAVNSLIITILIFIATIVVAWHTGFFKIKEEEK